jgi:choline kinase
MSLTDVAVILAAGVGSRLRPLTDDRPKALVSLGSETLLSRQIRLLVEHGVRRVVVATGYREDAVRRALAVAPCEVILRHNPCFDSTQNSVSLALCRDAVGRGAFFKLDADVVFQREVLARLDDASAALRVAIDSTRAVDEEAMKVVVGAGNRILTFGKAVAIDASGGESIGIELVPQNAVDPLFDALGAAGESQRTDLYYEDVYAELIAAGSLLAVAVEVGDLPWTEVDTPRDLERARALVRRYS